MAHGEPKSLNWGGGSGRFSEYTKGGRGGVGGGVWGAFFASPGFRVFGRRSGDERSVNKIVRQLRKS